MQTIKEERSSRTAPRSDGGRPQLSTAVTSDDVQTLTPAPADGSAGRAEISEAAPRGCSPEPSAADNQAKKPTPLVTPTKQQPVRMFTATDLSELPVSQPLEQVAKKLKGSGGRLSLRAEDHSVKGMFKRTAALVGEEVKPPTAGRPAFASGFAKVVADAYSEKTGGVDLETILKDKFTATVTKPQPPVIYDPKSHLRNLFSWNATAIKLVFYSLDFWALLGGNVALNVFYHGGVFGIPAPDEFELEERREQQFGAGGWPRFQDEAMLIMGAFITFFLVFFNSQAYHRFFQEYFISCKIRYSATSILQLTRTHMVYPDVQLNIMRFIHSAMYLGYMYLPQNYDLPGLVVDSYQRLISMKCLTAAEAKFLQAMPTGKPHIETLLWAARVMRKEMKRDVIKVPIYRAFESKCDTIRDLFDDLENYTFQPIPFAYYHLVQLVTEVYLITLCYTSVQVSAYWSILGYGLVLVAICGLREAAGCLADPLGLDESDIPVFDQIRDMHYWHVYCLTKLPQDPPQERPIPGFGSEAHISEVVHGIQPHLFVDGVPEDAVKAMASEEAVKDIEQERSKRPSMKRTSKFTLPSSGDKFRRENLQQRKGTDTRQAKDLEAEFWQTLASGEAVDPIDRSDWKQGLGITVNGIRKTPQTQIRVANFHNVRKDKDSILEEEPDDVEDAEEDAKEEDDDDAEEDNGESGDPLAFD